MCDKWGLERGIMIVFDVDYGNIMGLILLVRKIMFYFGFEVVCYNGFWSYVLVGFLIEVEVVIEVIKKLIVVKYKVLNVIYGFYFCFCDFIIFGFEVLVVFLIYNIFKIRIEMILD